MTKIKEIREMGPEDLKAKEKVLKKEEINARHIEVVVCSIASRIIHVIGSVN